MRLSFLLLALVAAATAVPQLTIKAANVDGLKKQRDCLLLLQQVFQDIPNLKLRQLGKEYNIEKNLQEYRDQGVVKYLIRAVKLGYIQRKGVPFSESIAPLRKEVTVLTRTLLSARTYETFLKTAAWARTNLNEAQFVKAFVAAILQRHDTRDLVVLPAPYEVFPYYFFDTRVIRKAQDLRAKEHSREGRSQSIDEESTKPVIEIPVQYGSAFLPNGEGSLAYFTQDIGLASYYAYFNLAGSLLPEACTTTTEGHNTEKSNCEPHELGRGARYYYIHQQLLARYNLERLSNNLRPIQHLDWSHIRTPFKPHLSYPNGLEFPGRSFDINLIPEKQELVKTAWVLERRLKDAIDSGFTFSAQSSILSLYNRKGLDVLGNLIEATGRSINPRYYGSLQGVARELLGGGSYARYFYEPTPTALEIPLTATRDPVFYQLFERIISLFKRYQDALPYYKKDDLILPGVKIEDVSVSKLVTYSDKFQADIDSATFIPNDNREENTQIKATLDRLNHAPYNFNIIVNSENEIKGAIVRIYIGPKFDFEGRCINIQENRLRFVELDQFIYDIKKGRTTIQRKSVDAPMRSVDALTKKDLLREVEDALGSRKPFYPEQIAQRYGFPERLALPKGKRDGLPLRVVVLISSPEVTPVSYDPVVPSRFQTYQNVHFEDSEGDYAEDIVNIKHQGSCKFTQCVDIGEDYDQPDVDEIHEKKFRRDRPLVGLFGGKSSGLEDYRDYEFENRHTHKVRLDENVDLNVHNLTDYYKNKHSSEMIGGAISLDGRPFGYPFDRPLNAESLFIPNLKVVNVKVYWEGKHSQHHQSRIPKSYRDERVIV